MTISRPIVVGDIVMYEDWCGPQKVTSIHFINDPDKTKSIDKGDLLFVSLEPVDNNSLNLGHDVHLFDVEHV